MRGRAGGAGSGIFTQTAGFVHAGVWSDFCWVRSIPPPGLGLKPNNETGSAASSRRRLDGEGDFVPNDISFVISLSKWKFDSRLQLLLASSKPCATHCGEMLFGLTGTSSCWSWKLSGSSFWLRILGEQTLSTCVKHACLVKWQGNKIIPELVRYFSRFNQNSSSSYIVCRTIILSCICSEWK